MKYVPKVNEELYLRQSTGNPWVDMVKIPYTVIEVSKNENYIYVQEARCVFPTPRYYDTLPIAIYPDEDGRIKKLRWNERKGLWVETPADRYPEFAVFGKYVYQPYLD